MKKLIMLHRIYITAKSQGLYETTFLIRNFTGILKIIIFHKCITLQFQHMDSPDRTVWV